jgi:hypothetical protein
VSLPGGKLIHPIYMMYLIYPNPYPDDREWRTKQNVIAGIAQYQIVQETETDFVIRIVREPGMDLDLSYIVGNFKKFLGEGIRAELEFVDNVPMASSGKRQYVVSQVNPTV